MLKQLNISFSSSFIFLFATNQTQTMATLFQKRRQKPDPRRQNDGRCKKHPKHRQSPGVCSVCLREKLAQIDKKPSARRTTVETAISSTTSSLSSYYSSSSASSSSSPVANVSSSFLMGGSVLKKSRSLAFFPSYRRNVDDDKSHDEEKRNSGFWSKLMKRNRPAQERTTFMPYSRTVRERSSLPEQRL